MPSVIDSLVLELSLDASKFTAGQRAAIDSLRKFQEAAVAGGKEVESQSKKIFDLIVGMKTGILTAVGAFLGGREIVDFFNYVTRLDAATSRLGKTMGIATEEMGAWQGAFKAVGGTAESAMGALGGLNADMVRFTLTGQSAMLPVLSRLGVGLFDANRHLKTSGALWLDLADAVQGMDPRDAAAFLSMIPGANQDMINFALLGRPTMEKYLAVMRQTTRGMKESAEAAIEYQKAAATLDQASTNLGRTFTTLVSPALSAAAEKLTQLLLLWKQTPGESAITYEQTKAELNARFGTARSFLEGFREVELGTNTPVPASRSKWNALVESVVESLYGAAGAGAGVAGWRRGAELRVKPGAGMASPAVEALAADLQANVPGLKQFTAFNDAHHRGRGAHGQGRALDFTVEDPSQYASTAVRVRALLAQRGIAATVDDESTRRSAGWTGPHIHVALGNAAGMAPGLAGRGAGGGGGVTVNGVTVNVNAPHATDAEGIAHHIGPALMRSINAAAANGGQK